MDIITTATSVEEGDRAASVAVLPVGSFEQHGSHLPLATNTFIACAIASRLSQRYDLLLLSPITISCSHEHAAFPGTVSISASTLHLIVRDISASLSQSGVQRLILVNGHGGNYVLSNIAQESNAESVYQDRRMLLFPGRADWQSARSSAGISTTASADMHGGEGETSILLQVMPEVVRDSWRTADHEAESRPDLLTLGVEEYTKSGIIGKPSAASAAKGEALLNSLTDLFESHLQILLQ
ncbi:MAG: creatininase family protein [Nocardioides sp.]